MGKQTISFEYKGKVHAEVITSKGDIGRLQPFVNLSSGYRTWAKYIQGSFKRL